MQSTKRQIYDKVSKFFPYDSPYFLFPNNARLDASLIYVDLAQSALENSQDDTMVDESSEVEVRKESLIEDRSSSSAAEGDVTSKFQGDHVQMIKLKQTEIDVTTSCQEEQVKSLEVATTTAADLESDQVMLKKDLMSQSVLYKPYVTKQSAMMNASTIVKQLDLEPVIALSRQTDAIFNVNLTLSAEAHEDQSKEMAL